MATKKKGDLPSASTIALLARWEKGKKGGKRKFATVCAGSGEGAQLRERKKGDFGNSEWAGGAQKREGTSHDRAVKGKREEKWLVTRKKGALVGLTGLAGKKEKKRGS